MTLNIRYLFLFALTFLYICFLSTIGHSAEEQLKHVNFKVAKDVIQTYIIDAASNVNKNYIGDTKAFRDNFIFETSHEIEKFQKTTDYNVEIKIFFDDKLKTKFIKPPLILVPSGLAVGSIIVKYKDKNGEIGWRFDVVFEAFDKKPIIFVNPYPDKLNNNTISEK